MTYLQIIDFCKILTIPQLIKFKELYSKIKSREYLVACVILELKTKRK